MCKSRIDWNAFRKGLDNLISLDQPLTTTPNIEIEVENLTKNIQEVAGFASNYKTHQEKGEYHPQSKQKSQEKDTFGNRN